MSRQVILVWLLLCVGCYSKITLPQCKRDVGESELNSCLLAAVKELLAKVADGIPEVGIQPLDPYVQDNDGFHHGTAKMRAKVSLMNFTTTGLKEAKVHAVRAKIDDDRFHLEVNTTQKIMQIAGQYSAVGRYINLKINSSGDFNVTMRNLNFRWNLDGKPKKKSGSNETILRIKRFVVLPGIGRSGGMKINVTNLVPHNQELTEFLNDLANDNWRHIMSQHVLTVVSWNWAKIGKKVANKLLRSVPYQELFPRA